MPTTLPYGSWPSPIDLELLTAGSVGLSSPGSDGEAIYWLESRPQEKGRTVLVRQTGDETTDVTPAPFNVRSGVHEYGGGAYAVADGVVVFSHYTDGRLYLVQGDAEPRPITPDLPDRVLRYADLELDLARGRVLAVREDHRRVGEPNGPRECVNTIVAVDLDADADPDANAGEVLVDGHDFVSSPRLSPDGHRLAWYTWEHPAMPWDSSRLWTGDPDAGDAQLLDGGDGVSVSDIGWLADGRPAWCSDRTGFANLYVQGPAGGQIAYQVQADCADPAWVFGGRSWAQTDDGAVLIRRSDPAGVTLVRLEEHSDARSVVAFTVTELPTTVAGLRDVVPSGDSVLTVAEFSDRPFALCRVDGATGEIVEIKSGVSETVDAEYFSIAEPISWPSADGAQTHGFFYPPANPRYAAPAGELPPLIVLSHGGPTGATSPGLSLAKQYWTSRGFAILDVNYGGSSGYGRAYRDRLQDNWGIVDVDDCCSGAEYLVQQGRVDGNRLSIRGGSAGGYTTLAALAFRDVFAVGVSKYGIGDLETLATDTHKFESRYLDGLVGQYPEQRQIYLDRSPIHHVEQLDCALLLLQGVQDKVVPPDQASSMADAVRAKGRPVALRMYEGEGHGFRMAETVQDATGSELAFYGQIFGFAPADRLPDLDIDNLPA